MKLLDLFSGIGGISLAAHWAGMETAAFCEIEPFCQKVLAKNFPGIPIFDDVKKLTKEMLIEKGVMPNVSNGNRTNDDIRILSAGYP